LIQNLHTHTCFSDGSDKPEVYIQAALEQGLSSLGFSDHSPLPFDNKFALREENVDLYCKTILSLKNSTREMGVFLGMEVDYIPDLGYTAGYFRNKYPLDYIIGSVHLVRNPDVEELWFIDGPNVKTYDDGLFNVFMNNGKAGVSAYYKQIQEMVIHGKPDVIGHLDKIKMHNHNRFFSETDSWYQHLIDDVLDLIRQAGCIVEVNTRGVYKKRADAFFPGPEVLKKIKNNGIPVTICSDAHLPGELSLLYDDAKSLLKELGFKVIMIKTEHGWDENQI
jgi:histidinol-phosphatase (PHP family)